MSNREQASACRSDEPSVVGHVLFLSLFLSFPTSLIENPGSLLFRAGFRPRTTRFLRLRFVPLRTGSFVSAKGPKTIGACGRGPMGAFAPVPIVWASFDFRRVAPYAQDERERSRRVRTNSCLSGHPERNGVESKGAQTVLASKEVSGPGRSHARRRRKIAALDATATSPPFVRRGEGR